MRNYDELVTAALATGTFADYVGDGFSVPWQVALPLSLPIGFTMLVYKAYLDLRWFPGAQLHDWCYTPFGTAINVSRLEADSALQEFIGRDSPIDAAIVFAAVRAGGGPFFGVSQTGYHGEQASRSMSNIGLANFAILEGNFVATKCIMLLNGSTDRGNPQPIIGYSGSQHAFGVSEGFWSTLTIGDALLQRLNTLAVRRAAILPAEVRILGFRLYNDGNGAGRVVQSYLSGQFGNLNVAGDSLLTETRSTSTSAQRKFWIHCVPDGMVQRGEFTPTNQYAALVDTYLSYLGSNFSWYSNVKTLVGKILTISANGLVTLFGANPYAVGDQITIQRSYDPVQQRFRGGKFYVATVGPLGTQFTISGWVHGDCQGGQSFIPSRAIGSLGAGDGLSVIRAGIRKVGRPFEAYRGRVSKRRK